MYLLKSYPKVKGGKSWKFIEKTLEKVCILNTTVQRSGVFHGVTKLNIYISMCNTSTC